MTRVGVTGHQALPLSAVSYIASHVERLLEGLEAPITVYSSLAEGADQLVADLVLQFGGKLHAVIPAQGYEATFSDEVRAEYLRLLSAATSSTTLSFGEPSEAAYDAAGEWVVEHCDLLIAVWDGKPARGLGGTADAVSHALDLSRDVRVIWPPGLER